MKINILPIDEYWQILKNANKYKYKGITDSSLEI